MGLAGPGSILASFSGPNNCGNGIGTPREVEFLPLSDQYGSFIADEVIPFVASHPDVLAKYPKLKFTDDPTGRVVNGQSNGGVASFKAVFYKPDSFETAICRSPNLSFGNESIGYFDHTEHPHENAEFWLQEADGGQDLIANAAWKKKRRFWINSNQYDAGAGSSPPGLCPGIPAPPTGDLGNFLIAGNATAHKLAAKGNEVKFVYGTRACHTDTSLLLQELPEALSWAFRPWKKKLDKKHKRKH